VTEAQGQPADETSGRELLERELAGLGLELRIASIRGLSGGYAASAWLVTFSDGSSMAAKTMPGAPADLFRIEAEGLAVLAATRHLPTPGVIAATDRLLAMEPLAPRDDSEQAWERLARDLAAVHRATVHDRFGWPSDGYLGRVAQRNPWTGGGHEFFARHRLLRYLEEPAVQRELTPADRLALEHFCDRLPEIIPPMPPVLTHGDLWAGNLLSTNSGRLAMIDPAVSYTWAEVDLSMLWCCQRPPASRRFFDAYQEINPSPAGWAERMPLLHLRELLSSIAHTDNPGSHAARLRSALAPFYRR
jgi:fructosamine-3-kinase